MNNFSLLSPNGNKIRFKSAEGWHEVSYQQYMQIINAAELLNKEGLSEREFEVIRLEYIIQVMVALSNGITADDLKNLKVPQLVKVYKLHFSFIDDKYSDVDYFYADGDKYIVPKNFEKTTAGEWMDTHTLLNALEENIHDGDIGIAAMAVYCRKAGEKYINDSELILKRKELFLKEAKMNAVLSVAFFLSSLLESVNKDSLLYGGLRDWLNMVFRGWPNLDGILLFATSQKKDYLSILKSAKPH